MRQKIDGKRLRPNGRHVSTGRLGYKSARMDALIHNLCSLQDEAIEAKDLEMVQFLDLLLEYAEEPTEMVAVFRNAPHELLARVQQLL